MSDPPIPELLPGETELVGMWAGGGARPDVWCTVTDRIYRLLPGLEVPCKGSDDRERGLYRDPRDGRLWEFADLEPWDWNSECRLAVVSTDEAIRRYPVRHEALHGLVLGLLRTGRLSSAPDLLRRNAAAMLADCESADRALGLVALADLSRDEDAGVRIEALDALYCLDPEPPTPEMGRRLRVLIKDRMERAGMHWTEVGAQAMLDLRSVWISGQWEAFQTERIEQETERLYPYRELIAGEAFFALAV